ncbi:MAG: PstS family phosphate ABC transporter substrate-binding protein [Pseudomonadota bacterium]
MTAFKQLTMAACVLALAACSGKKTADVETTAKTAAAPVASAMTGNVNVDGSSTVFPVSEAMAEEFQKEQPKVRVSVGVSGTGGGFKKFMAGEIDISNASRPIKEKELKMAEEAKVTFIELPIAYDGLSIVVNKDNDFIDAITVAELKKIWEPESKVTKWSEVRDGWPDEKIKLYGPGADSGTFDYFTKAINGKEGASRADYGASEDDNVIVNGVAGDKYSLGFFGFAYYAANKAKLKVVPVDGGNGPVTPTLETINNATYKPLSRPIFIYVNTASLAKPQVAEFAKFYVDNAATLAEEVGYIRLPEAIYAKVKARLQNKETGTGYNEKTTMKAAKLL